MNYNRDGIDNLANAILEQTAKEYLFAKRYIEKLEKKGLITKKDRQRHKNKLQEIEDLKIWFRSEKFHLYSLGISGEYFLKKLDEMAADNSVIHRQPETHKRRKRNNDL